MEKIINTIQNYLEISGSNTNQLARQANIPQPVLHRILHGQTANPRMQTLQAIAAAMKVPMSQFFTESEAAHDRIPLYLAPGQAQSQTKQYLPWHGENSQHMFAIHFWDDSMAPVFPQSCQLIFHRQTTAKHEDYVLIKGPEYWLFRQLIQDGKQQYLYAVNPSIGSSTLNANETIIAVLIESRIQWNHPSAIQARPTPAMRVVSNRQNTLKLFP